MYNDIITFYSKTPLNKWELQNYTVKHFEENNVCGDDLEVFLQIKEGKVTDFSFDGDTAIITTACASIFGESIIGMELEEVLTKDYEYIESLIGMPVSSRRRQAAVLWLLTTRNAIHDHLEDGKKDDFDDVID